MKIWTKTIPANLVVFLTVALASIWLFQPARQSTTKTWQTDAVEAPPAQNHISEMEEPQQPIFGGDDQLFHHGYDVKRVDGKAPYSRIEESGKSSTEMVDVSYAVVRQNGRTIAKFDGVHYPLGNLTDFGLFGLLGNKSEQLLVSLTVPRGGRHWVVSLDPTLRVLFDSDDYGVGREEFFVVDIEKDRVYEIVLPVTAFYEMQDKMYIGEIPLPEIIFKYDAAEERYFPANHLYPEYSLRHLDAKFKSLPEDPRDNYLSKRLSILLTYVYAGKEQEGWAFFDEYYRLPDKEEMKTRIRTVLRDEGVYKYLY